jgi:hypothetical protein
MTPELCAAVIDEETIKHCGGQKDRSGSKALRKSAILHDFVVIAELARHDSRCLLCFGAFYAVFV